MKLNLPSTTISFREYDVEQGEMTWAPAKYINYSETFYSIPYACPGPYQGDVSDYIVIFIEVRYFTTSNKSMSRVRFLRDFENIEYFLDDGKLQDLIMCCIPEHALMDDDTIEDEITDTFRSLLDMLPSSPAISSGYEPDTRQYLVGQEDISAYLIELASWGTLFFPLTDSSLFSSVLSRYYPIPSEFIQTARQFFQSSIANNSFQESEDLDMVRAFLVDPMDKDSFEHLASYLFPMLIKEGKLPSGFPLVHEDFVAFLTNFSDLIIDEEGTISSALSSVSPKTELNLQKALESYLKEAFEEVQDL